MKFLIFLVYICKKKKKNTNTLITIYNIFYIFEFNYVNTNIWIQTIQFVVQSDTDDRPKF